MNVINAQSEEIFSIGGQVKIASEKGKYKPTSACLRIRSIKKATCTKEGGNFRIDGVKCGKYQLEVVGLGLIPFDTIISVSGNIMELLLVANCKINYTTAINDIKIRKPRLHTIGGVAPANINDKAMFESKYGVKYNDLGDIPPPLECIEQYNFKIFEYLDSRFGKFWRDEVNDRVIGIKKWKEEKTT